MTPKTSASARLSDTAQLLEEGKKAYNNKTYNNALSFFKRAQASAKPQTSVQIQILDHLVGVYVKLQDINQAFIAAKSMIRWDRSDSRGYLRCGQVRRIEEDYSSACVWYQQGLKNVKANDELRKSLQSSLDRCREAAKNKLMESKARDPIFCLPFEIALTILAYLDYKEHMSLLRVCKAWNRLVLGQPPVSNTIDFSGAKRMITFTELRVAVKRLHCYPTKLVVSKLSTTAARYLNERLEWWSKKPTIQHLAISHLLIQVEKLSLQSATLRTLIIDDDTCIRNEDVETILRGCHRLRTLSTPTVLCFEGGRVFDFGNSFRQNFLRTLIISTVKQFQTFSCFPGLCHLKYYCYSTFDHEELDLTSNAELRYVELSAINISTILPAQVETFKCRRPGVFRVEENSNLSHLELRFVPHLLRQCVNATLPDVFDQIKTLALGFDRDSEEYDPDVLSQMISQCPGVEHIQFDCDMFGDADLGMMVGRMTKLRSLAIENARITGAFLADMLKTDSCQIQKISLRDCSMVSRDTWNWIRQRGISLEIKNSKDLAPNFGGRKLIDQR